MFSSGAVMTCMRGSRSNAGITTCPSVSSVGRSLHQGRQGLHERLHPIGCGRLLGFVIRFFRIQGPFIMEQCCRYLQVAALHHRRQWGGGGGGGGVQPVSLCCLAICVFSRSEGARSPALLTRRSKGASRAALLIGVCHMGDGAGKGGGRTMERSCERLWSGCGR